MQNDFVGQVFDEECKNGGMSLIILLNSLHVDTSFGIEASPVGRFYDIIVSKTHTALITKHLMRCVIWTCIFTSIISSL